VLLILVLASALYVGVRVLAQVDRALVKVIATPVPVTGTPKPTPNPLTDPINILLLGLDRREDLNDTRSDVNIVVHVDPKSLFVSMLSVPRDTLVYIPDLGYDKINAAYSFGQQYHADEGGGPVWAKKTMASFLGIPIDYYAEVDFKGFERIVDYLGGITVDVPAPLVDNQYPTADYGFTRLYIPAGLQHMDGATALKYARSRHADSDLGRNRRQQQVLMAMRERVLGLNLVTDQDQISALLGQFANTFKTDIQRDTLWSLYQLAPKIEGDTIASYAVDWECLVEISGTSYLEPLMPCVEDRVYSMLLDPTMRKLSEEGARVEVLNGTLTCDGCAAKTAAYLDGRGFGGVTFGNAENPGSYTHTLILDAGDHPFTRAQLVKLLKVRPEAARQVESNPSGADIVLILGNDFVLPEE
jgi:LCP family protein required for cell wall assembly